MQRNPIRCADYEFGLQWFSAFKWDFKDPLLWQPTWENNKNRMCFVSVLLLFILFFLNKILPQDTCCKSAWNPFPAPIRLMFDFEFFENDAKHKFLANLIFHSTHENASGTLICNFNGKTAMIRKINTFPIHWKLHNFLMFFSPLFCAMF